MSTTAIVLCILVVCLLVVGFAFLFWWLRTQSGMAIRSFYVTVRRMEHQQGVESRYQTPWLLLLGDPYEGEQLCRDWQLMPVGRQAWFGRWWADQDGSVLAVPQAVFLPRDGANTPAFLWRQLLGMLLRLRGQRPLDGVIWAIPFAQLQDSAQNSADAIVIRRRFSELLQRLGLEVPVYVLITGLEEMSGFQDLVAELPIEAREQLLGWSSVHGLESNWQAYWLDDALEAVVQSVQASIIESSALSGVLAEDLYRLPDRLLGIQDNLRRLLEPVFQGNTHGESPNLRGLYFGAVQASENSVIEGLYSSGNSGLKGVFTKPLWRQRVLAESGLAKALPRVLRMRQRWQKTVAGVAAVLGVFWLVSMLWVWQARDHEAQELSRLLQEADARTENGVCKVNVLDTDNYQAHSLCRVQAFWRLLQLAPRWHFSSVVYPTSWGTLLDTQMDLLLRDTARREALIPLQQLQSMQLKMLLEIRNDQRRADVESSQPDHWQNYVKARSLVSGVLSLEQRNRLLNAALVEQQSVTDLLAQLGNETFALNLDAASLPKKTFYDQVLQGLAAPGLRPVNLQPSAKQLSEQFQTLMKFWLAQYFLAGNFVTPAGYLKRNLEDLESGRDLPLQKLEEINGLIGQLEDLILLTNAAWGYGAGEELVPGYQALMKDVKQSRLLGPAVEATVALEAGQLRRTFHNQWIDGAASRENLLQRQANGSLVLQSSIRKLSRSIEDLLRRDFAVFAMSSSFKGDASQTLSSVTKEQLTQALGYLESYQSFVTQELPQISPSYRSGMLRTAEWAVAQAMWQVLVSSSSQHLANTANTGFNISVEQARQVIQALKALGQEERALMLQSQLTARAMLGVDVALVDIDSLPLFTERYPVDLWDGKSQLGLKLFRSNDVQDLKQSLKRQFVQIGLSADKAMSELVWLNAQSNLPLVAQEKLLRLNSIAEEMKKYKEQNPISAPALFEQLVSRDLVDIDSESCPQVLQTATLPQGTGDLARHTRTLVDQVSKRCSQLQVQGAAHAWRELADYFNQYLAGRFPFSYGVDSPDADPARVQYLLDLIDAHADVATKGLSLVPEGDRLAAADFLSRMKLARGWLGVMLERDKSETIGVELDVRWRTDRKDEQGADQIIDWTLFGGSQSVSHPSEDTPRLRWSVGAPLQLVLRWARDSSQRPSIDPLQASMAVNGLEAGWDYRGSWALLRMIRTHTVSPRLPEMNYTDFPLTLNVPVRGALTAESQAQMFMRVSLLSQGGKLPLSIQTLPVVAPKSPFSNMLLQAQGDIGTMP